MSLKTIWFIPVNHRNYDAMPASVWIRCLQLLPYLEKAGVQCTINEPDAEADICIFVRWQNDQAHEIAQQQNRMGRRIIFDLCVNYFDETGLFEGGYGSTAERVEECKRMVDIADVITCASAYIAQRATDFHPRVVHFPDSIDVSHFRFHKQERDFHRRKLRAIWSGISTKAKELEPILPLLRHHDISLVVISNERPSLSMDYKFVFWSYRTFPRDILGGEICIAPRRVDNPYDLGHSLFKIGVFMSEGVPAIASPLPSYIEVLGDQSPVICRSLDEWDRALQIAIQERQTLVAWSRQAWERIKRYHTHNVAEEYVALFKKLCFHKA